MAQICLLEIVIKRWLPNVAAYISWFLVTLTQFLESGTDVAIGHVGLRRLACIQDALQDTTDQTERAVLVQEEPSPTARISRWLCSAPCARITRGVPRARAG